MSLAVPKKVSKGLFTCHITRRLIGNPPNKVFIQYGNENRDVFTDEVFKLVSYGKKASQGRDLTTHFSRTAAQILNYSGPSGGLVWKGRSKVKNEIFLAC